MMLFCRMGSGNYIEGESEDVEEDEDEVSFSTFGDDTAGENGFWSEEEEDEDESDKSKEEEEEEEESKEEEETKEE